MSAYPREKSGGILVLTWQLPGPQDAGRAVSKYCPVNKKAQSGSHVRASAVTHQCHGLRAGRRWPLRACVGVLAARAPSSEGTLEPLRAPARLEETRTARSIQGPVGFRVPCGPAGLQGGSPCWAWLRWADCVPVADRVGGSLRVSRDLGEEPWSTLSLGHVWPCGTKARPEPEAKDVEIVLDVTEGGTVAAGLSTAHCS